MSGKFKPGDLVELLSPTIPVLDPKSLHLKPGMIGTVVRYLGYEDQPDSRYHVDNSWEVIFPSELYSYAINESILRLVPGGDEYLAIGNWSECPWNPYKEKIDENATYDFL